MSAPSITLPKITFQSFDPAAPEVADRRSPQGWPTLEAIKEKIALSFSGFRAQEAAGIEAVVVPGFRDFRVDGVRVGEWLTSERAFGDGGEKIVGVRFADERMDGWIVFRDPDGYDRHQKHLALAKAEIKLRPKDDPEKRVENAIAAARRAAGHIVEQQVLVPTGIVDIVDRTARQVIECKASSKTSFVMAAVDQLDRYMPHFDGYTQAVGLPDLPQNTATARMLARAEITVLTPELPVMDRRQQA